MRGLMDSDVRNLGRLAAFVRDAMPFDVIPVRARLLMCMMQGHSGSSQHSLADPMLQAVQPVVDLSH